MIMIYMEEIKNKKCKRNCQKNNVKGGGKREKEKDWKLRECSL